MLAEQRNAFDKDAAGPRHDARGEVCVGGGSSAQHRLMAVITHGGDGSPTKQTGVAVYLWEQREWRGQITTAAKPEGTSICAFARRLLVYPAEHFRCCLSRGENSGIDRDGNSLDPGLR